MSTFYSMFLSIIVLILLKLIYHRYLLFKMLLLTTDITMILLNIIWETHFAHI